MFDRKDGRPGHPAGSLKPAFPAGLETRKKDLHGKEIDDRQERPRAYYRKFGLCRVCLRELANKGELPGVTKASW